MNYALWNSSTNTRMNEGNLDISISLIVKSTQYISKCCITMFSGLDLTLTVSFTTNYLFLNAKTTFYVSII